VSGGHTGFDPYFYAVAAVFIAASIVCLGLAYWMP